MKKIFFEKEKENLKLKEELRIAKQKKKKPFPHSIKQPTLQNDIDGPLSPQNPSQEIIANQTYVINKSRPHTTRVIF